MQGKRHWDKEVLNKKITLLQTKTLERFTKL